MCKPGIGDVCVMQGEPFQVHKSVQVLQPGIGDICVRKAEVGQFAEPRQFFKTCVRDGRFPEPKHIQPCQFLQSANSQIGDGCSLKPEASQIRQCAEMVHPCVRHVSTVETE